MSDVELEKVMMEKMQLKIELKDAMRDAAALFDLVAELTRDRYGDLSPEAVRHEISYRHHSFLEKKNVEYWQSRADFAERCLEEVRVRSRDLDLPFEFLGLSSEEVVRRKGDARPYHIYDRFMFKVNIAIGGAKFVLCSVGDRYEPHEDFLRRCGIFLAEHFTLGAIQQVSWNGVRLLLGCRSPECRRELIVRSKGDVFLSPLTKGLQVDSSALQDPDAFRSEFGHLMENSDGRG